LASHTAHCIGAHHDDVEGGTPRELALHIQFHIAPEVSLSAPPLFPPADLYQTATHAQHHMAGLVLGIHVLPVEGSGPVRASASMPRKLTVVVGETGKRYAASAISFSLPFGGSFSSSTVP